RRSLAWLEVNAMNHAAFRQHNFVTVHVPADDQAAPMCRHWRVVALKPTRRLCATRRNIASSSFVSTPSASMTAFTIGSDRMSSTDGSREHVMERLLIN